MTFMGKMVGVARFELATPAMSMQRLALAIVLDFCILLVFAFARAQNMPNVF